MIQPRLPVIPSAAKRSEESKTLALPHSPPTQYSLLPSSLRTLRGESPTQNLAPRTQHHFHTTFSLFLKIWSLNYFDCLQLDASIRPTEIY